VGQYMDLPPELNTVTALSSDPAAAYRAAVDTSATTSLNEAFAFSDSAVHRLDGHKLTFLDGDDARTAFLATVPAAHAADWKRLLAQYQGSTMLVPAGASADAAWVIDPHTGSATAVMLDGSGGGCDPWNGWDTFNLALFGLGIGCNFYAAPFFCAGVTTAQVAMMAKAVIEDVKSASSYGNLASFLFGIGTIPFVGARGFLGHVPQQVMISLLATGTFAISQGCYE
jgi:hypothetical protein